MTLPTYTLDPNTIKFRYGERYISEASNRSFRGLPLGVHRGFEPSVAGTVLSLAPDAATGTSLARVVSGVDPRAVVDVFLTEAVTLDFAAYIDVHKAGTPGVVFPVFVVLTGSYSFGSTSSARIETQTTAPSGETEVLLCVCYFAADTLSVGFSAPLERTTPYAYAGAPLGFGYMLPGHAEGLDLGLQIVDEVKAARTDLDGTTHGDLASRLAVDFSAAGIGRSVEKQARLLDGGTFTLSASLAFANVSEAFAAVHRSALPLLDIAAGGSETTEGAVAGPLDSRRNVAVVVDAGTGQRPVDDTPDRNPIYGRIVYDETLMTGSYSVNNGSAAVTGAGTQFLSEVQVGDVLLMPDGDFYAVASITDDLNLTLLAPYGGSSGLVVAGVRRRFLLTFLSRVGGVESVALLPAGTYRFFFPAFFGIDTPVFDAATELFADGLPERLGNATTTETGRVLLDPNAASSPAPLAGALQEVRSGGQVVSSNAYDWNFDGAQAGAPGVVDVTQRGPQGPKGPDGSGSPGPAGPEGDPGVGFDGGINHASTAGNNHMWIKGPIVDHAALGFNVTYHFTVDAASFGISEVLWATAGIWYMRDYTTPFRGFGENWRIVQVTRDTPTQVTVSAATEVSGSTSIFVEVGVALNIAGKA